MRVLQNFLVYFYYTKINLYLKAWSHTAVQTSSHIFSNFYQIYIKFVKYLPHKIPHLSNCPCCIHCCILWFNSAPSPLIGGFWNARKQMSTDDNQAEISAGLQSQVLSPQMQARGLAVLTVLISCFPLCATQSAFHAPLELAHICIHSSALQRGQLIIITNHLNLWERTLIAVENAPSIAAILSSLQSLKSVFED